MQAQTAGPAARGGVNLGYIRLSLGIVPDREVRPTIAGIRDGRDEVLEAALREILGPRRARRRDPQARDAQ